MRPYSLVIAGLVLMALLGGLGGCGESARDKDSPYGAVIAQVVWPAETQSAALSRPAGPMRWVVPVGVTTIKGFITAADIDTPPETTIAVAEGDSGTGLIENVPIGSDRTLTVQGLDASGTVIFEGVTTGIIVNSGETTDAGTV